MQQSRRARPPAFWLSASILVVLAWSRVGPSPAGAAAPGRLVGESTSTVGYSVGPISDVSVGCPGTGDVSEAVDGDRGDVYQAFEGCDHAAGIGFARSTDGGDAYGPPVALPDSHGGWDPWLAVAPDGTLYAAFMDTIGSRTYPIVDVSHDHGQTFAVERSLRPDQDRNWGDAEYMAVGADGTLYVAWSYGPSDAKVKSACSPIGSCWATHGDLNVVVQSSTDDAATFSPMSVVNPGYPDGGADEGDVVVGPDGAVDVLYQGYQVVNRRTLQLADGHEYFTSSTDRGRTWSPPVEVGADAGQITIDEWWNDGSVATDAAGDVYAAWDTQGEVGDRRTDVGWVAFSGDGGRTWSVPLRATPDEVGVPHIMEVAGGGRGEAFVAWLSSSDPLGYGLYLRTLSIGAGAGATRWLSGAARVSQQFGDPRVFPGDTFGLEAPSPTSLVVSWGSAVSGSHHKASVSAAPVRVVSGAAAPGAREGELAGPAGPRPDPGTRPVTTGERRGGERRRPPG